MPIDKFLEEVKSKLAQYKKFDRLNKRLHSVFSMFIIIFAALTPIVAAFEANMESGIMLAGYRLPFTVFIGSVVLLLEATSRQFRFKETWLRYRLVQVRLENETRMFENNIGKYNNAATATELYKTNANNIIKTDQEQWYEVLMGD